MKEMPFTFVGRLLVLVSLLLTAGTGCLFFVNLPPGRYPIVLLLLPSIVVGGFFFGIASALLHQFGYPVWQNQSIQR